MQHFICSILYIPLYFQSNYCQEINFMRVYVTSYKWNYKIKKIMHFWSPLVITIWSNNNYILLVVFILFLEIFHHQTMDLNSEQLWRYSIENSSTNLSLVLQPRTREGWGREYFPFALETISICAKQKNIVFWCYALNYRPEEFFIIFLFSSFLCKKW